jgi:cell wall-associated NlpC family hydrolase
MTGDALAAAAAALVGTPFRLHGRNPATGLDCIGLLAAALADRGRRLAVPTGYPLRLRSLNGWLPDPAASGFALAEPPFIPGDVVMLQPGPAQFHLAIAAPGMGWIHAHAGLRRVVRDPALPAGPIIHHWRILPAAES